MAPNPPQLPALDGRRHALGPADDTTVHLAALAGPSQGARQAATEHLDAAIAPGGRAWPVSADVAQYVSELLLADLVSDSATRVSCSTSSVRSPRPPTESSPPTTRTPSWGAGRCWCRS
ncbi:MAG: hypothetical protein WKF57_19640 [Nakamurella sp.]